MKGNKKDCICSPLLEKHTRRCDAYRLSEFTKKAAATIQTCNCNTQGIECDMHPTCAIDNCQQMAVATTHATDETSFCRPHYDKAIRPKQDTQETWEESFDKEFRFKLDIMLKPDQDGDRVEVNGEWTKLKDFFRKEKEKTYKKELDMQWRCEKLIKIREKEAYEKARGEAVQIINDLNVVCNPCLDQRVTCIKPEDWKEEALKLTK